jgi:hypothetical protein
MYESGGLFLRGNIGFHKRFQFGFSGNATNVIGHGDIEVQEPRLAVKFKPLLQGRFPVSMAVGWDDRGYGVSEGRRFHPGLQKGLYLAASREFPKAGYLQVHGGANLVRLNDTDRDRDFGAFTGLAFGLSKDFTVSVELDKLTTDRWQFNAGFLVGVDDPVRVGLDFREMNRSATFARLLRIQYLSFF